MNAIVWLTSQITETKIALICVLLIAIAYAIVLVRRRRQFDLNELALVIVNVVGVVVGVSMFVYAFKMPDTLSEQAKWTGIAGVCMAMLFFFQSVSVFRKVLAGGAGLRR
jgi:drug/metabolite transporter (DMT)-like permease